MSRTHIVRQGEDLYAIAWHHHLDPETVWQHPDNAELREQRTPQLLCPGDRLTLPDETDPDAKSIQPGGHHSFVADAPLHELRLRLRSGDGAHPEERYTAVVDGMTQEGTIDAEGHITLTVRPNTRRVRLTIHEDWGNFTHDSVIELDVGGLDPESEPTGVQARLRNLGYHLGPVDGDIGERTRAAVTDFQRRHELEETGELDDDTRARIVEEHGV